MVNKNLRRLVKNGRASQRDLTAAWDNIYSEYCELSGSPSYKTYLLLNKEVGFLRSKILSIKCCLEVLRHRPSDRAIMQLRSFGYSYPFNFEDKLSYYKDLTTVGEKSKAVELAYELKIRELEKMNAGAKTEPMTESRFTEITTALSKYIGYRLDSREITVSEFASIRKMYDEENEVMKKELDKHK